MRLAARSSAGAAKSLRFLESAVKLMFKSTSNKCRLRGWAGSPPRPEPERRASSMSDLAASAASDFPSSIRLMCCRGLQLGEVNKHGSGAVLFHRSNAVVAGCSRAIGLADTDDLVVGCTKREVRPAVGGG